MGSLIWFGAAVLLALLELLAGDFALLMLAGGALAAAGTSLAGGPLWLACLVFALVSTLLIVIARPRLKRRLLETTTQLDSSPQSLIGRQAIVVEEVTDHSGLIQVNNELWSARTLTAGDPHPVNSHVCISHVNSTTAFVIKNSPQ